MGKSSILLNTLQFISAKEINETSPNWFKEHRETNYIEILYMQEGCGEFIFEDKPFIGQEGDMIIFNPFSTVVVRTCTGSPLKAISICLLNVPIKGNQRLIDSSNHTIIRLQEEKDEIKHYFQTILREYDKKHSEYQDVITSILQTVIIKITRLLKTAREPSISEMSLKVRKYIEQNFSQELTLNILANLVYVSPYHLAHVFKEEVGLPPIQYLIQCRIQEAKRLLKHSDLSVRDIAAIIGYENPNYFNLLFKKITGSPPGKYRKNGIVGRE
ncbi:AraC family transcriptional regulator [Neobacillus sp. SuZ13]|uniref:AraC family transcriptional regulator n=1 Tax=Neobacillus sp. SuZ13 TaxID=3047875 RepID=UPI0024C0BFE8|nr:AraC family transcriptional regulator [Neobacillus sp. SuZ13]WHY68075.1 AraC family transcriptional regulator [Neobacillus sp. SuZ13]